MKSTFSADFKYIRFWLMAFLISSALFVGYYQSQSMKYSLFTSPDDLEDWDGHIQIAMVLKGLLDDSAAGFNLRTKLRNYVRSAILHAKQMPLRLIFLTDIKSVFQVEKTFQDLLPPFALVNTLQDGYQVDRFDRAYVDISQMTQIIQPWTSTMQKHFNSRKSSYELESSAGVRYKMAFSDRYNDTIYYLSPFYHKLFPHLKKLIVMDADMEFRADPYFLHEEFTKFHSDQIIGCANDLSPHYHVMLQASKFYDVNPESALGLPGQFQGLNVGVLLMRLDRMRHNLAYNEYLTSKGTEKLAATYGLTSSTLGAQDWLTLVSFDNPGLIFPLDCKFNRQLSLNYNHAIWEKTFESYHSCHKSLEFNDENALIVHLNGNHASFDDYKITRSLLT